jgi:hypothetical protein
VPGWSSGDVWTLRVAIRRTRLGTVDTVVTNSAHSLGVPSHVT